MRYARKYLDVDAAADRATLVLFGWFSQYCRYGILPTLSARQVQLLDVCCTTYCICPRRPWISGSRNGHDIHASASLQNKYAPALFHTSEAILLHEFMSRRIFDQSPEYILSTKVQWATSTETSQPVVTIAFQPASTTVLEFEPIYLRIPVS
jgi:hypothetical protein